MFNLHRIVLFLAVPFFAQTIAAQAQWNFGSANDTATLTYATGAGINRTTHSYNLCTGMPAPVQVIQAPVQLTPPYKIDEGFYYIVTSKQVNRLDTWSVKYRSAFLHTADPANKEAKHKLDKPLSKLMEEARVLGYHTAAGEFILEKGDKIIAVNPLAPNLKERTIFDFSRKLKMSKYEFSPAGNYLIATSSFPSIKNYLIQLTTGKLYLGLDIPARPNEFNYAISSDERQLLVHDVDDKVYRLYHLPGENLLWELPDSQLNKFGDRYQSVYFDNEHLYLVMFHYPDNTSPLKEHKKIPTPLVQVLKKKGTNLTLIRQYQADATQSILPGYNGVRSVADKVYSYDQLPGEHAKLLNYFKPIEAGFTLTAQQWNSNGYTLIKDSTLMNTWCFLSCAPLPNFPKYYNLYALGMLLENGSSAWLLAATATRGQELVEGQPFEINYSVHRYDKKEKRFRESYALGGRSNNTVHNNRLLHINIVKNRYQQIVCSTPLTTYTLNLQ